MAVAMATATRLRKWVWGGAWVEQTGGGREWFGMHHARVLVKFLRRGYTIRMHVSRPLRILVAMAVLDAIWLFATQPIYARAVQAVQHAPLTIRASGAALSYALLFLLIWQVALPLSEMRKSLLPAALTGLCAYGIFNATNIAIFKDYSWGVAALDTLWGGVLVALACAWAMRSKGT